MDVIFERSLPTQVIPSTHALATSSCSRYLTRFSCREEERLCTVICEGGDMGFPNAQRGAGTPCQDEAAYSGRFHTFFFFIAGDLPDCEFAVSLLM